MMRLLSLSTLVGLFVLSACSSDKKKADSFDYVTEVGPAGLTLRLPDDTARVMIPSGALKKATSIGFRSVEATSLPNLPSSLSAVSKVYEFTPHGLALEKSVRITLPHRGKSQSNLRVMRLADAAATEWMALTEGVTINASSVNLSVDHFSFYTVADGAEGAGDAGVGDAGAAGTGGSMTGTGGSMAGIDGGIDAGTATLPELIKQKFQDCGAILSDGLFSVEVSDTVGSTAAQQACLIDCYLASTCAEFVGSFCNASSLALDSACNASCTGAPAFEVITCPDSSEALRCDAKAECADNSDETSCPASAFFDCSDGTRLPAAERCNGPALCADGADEANCPADVAFVCDDGTRIAAAGKCDGYSACSKGEDESGCPPNNSFACDDGLLIPSAWRCDTFDDCANGEDESGCASEYFTCDDQTVISKRWVCDLDPTDCPDGSDEQQGCLQLDCTGAGGP